MFGRNSKKLETIVGDGTTLAGDMTVNGTARIDGAVDGNLSADWVIVGVGGKITGNIKARGTVIDGTVDGNVDAAEIVELKPKARVRGEIRTAKLAVSEGAAFDGHSRMTTDGDADNPSETRIVELKRPSNS